LLLKPTSGADNHDVHRLGLAETRSHILLCLEPCMHWIMWKMGPIPRFLYLSPSWF
jgi:hypothetical protein